MEAFLLACILVVLLVRWVVLHNRFSRIESRIDQLQNLVMRSPVAPPQPVAPVVERVVPTAPPVVMPVAPPAPPEPIVVHAPPPPPSIPPPPPHVEVPVPPAPMPQPARHIDWEAAVGGNLLNKAGVALLVIGLALALAYSFAHIGPLGRVAISLAVSFAMLIAGALVEPREKYRIFARGLLGGGWAALYTTVYAMHAVPEALVIPDAVLGNLLLIAVATGMIVHSLRYRSQTVTGLAYFIAFGTLAIAETNTLAVIALIPLAASLLYIVYRFNWTRMALLGLIATYSTIILRGDHGSPLGPAQALFAIFWLLFEAFDVMRPEAWLLPLNFVGFLGLSLLKWDSADPHDIWMLLAATAAAYLAGAIVRWRSGRWHAAATLAAGLAAAAIFQKFEGRSLPSALLVEAELVYLAGIGLGKRYLRWLGTALFTAQVGWLLVIDMGSLPLHAWTTIAIVDAVIFYANCALQAADVFFGYAATALLAIVIGSEAPERLRSLEWLALAAGTFAVGLGRKRFDFRLQGYLVGILGLIAVAFEVQSNHPALWGAVAASYALTLCATLTSAGRFFDREQKTVRYAAAVATTLAALALLWQLVPDEYLGLAWMAFGLILLELGLRRLPEDFSVHSYVAAALGAIRVLAFNLVPPTTSRSLIPALATLLAYAFAARAWTVRQVKVYAAALGVGTLFLLAALSLAVPESRSVPLWALVSLGLAAAGANWDEPIMSAYGFCVAILAFLRCWGINLEKHDEAILGASWASGCFFAAYLLSPRGRFARQYYPLLGALLITLLLWYESSGSMLTVAWGVEGLALLAAGFPLRERALRLSGLGLLLVCILKLFLWDLRHLETLPRIFSFIVLGLILVGVSWVYTRFREHVERYL